LCKVFERTDTTIPFFTSDELKHYKEAILGVYGVKEIVEKTGRRGRPRKPRVIPMEELDYAVVHKERQKGRVVEITKKVIYGSEERIEQKLKESPVSNCINTSHVERNNLSIRAGDARFTRKTLCFSKKKKFLIDSLNLFFGYYHLCRSHKGCMVDNKRQTPFMKAGLTDHIWTIEEVINYKI
jgi:hypothetical protein